MPIFYYILNLLVKILKFGGSMWKIEFVAIIYILMVAAFYPNFFPRTISMDGFLMHDHINGIKLLAVILGPYACKCNTATGTECVT